MFRQISKALTKHLKQQHPLPEFAQQKYLSSIPKLSYSNYKKTYPKKDDQQSTTSWQAIDNILQATFKKIQRQPIPSKFQPRKRYDIIGTHATELWHLYLGIKKMYPGFKRPEEIDINIFLPNNLCRYPQSIQYFDVIIDQYVEFFQGCEDAIVSDLKYFKIVVKTFTMYEKCYQTPKFWGLLDRVIEKLLGQAEKMGEEETGALCLFLKVLSKRDFYIRHQIEYAEKKGSEEELKKVQNLKEEVLKCLMNNPKHVRLTNWIGILTQLETTKDGSLPVLADYLKENVNASEHSSSECTRSFSKVVKKSYSPYFEPLLPVLQKHIIEEAKKHNLKVSELGYALASALYFSEEEFQILWRSLEFLVRFKGAKDFHIFTVAHLFDGLVSKNKFTIDKFNFLQSCALTALENNSSFEIKEGNRSIDFNNEEEEESVERLKPAQATQAVITIFNYLANKDVIQDLNFDLINKIFEHIDKHQLKIPKKNVSYLLVALPKLLQKIKARGYTSETYRTFLKKSLTIFERIGAIFVERLRTPSPPALSDIARGFLAYSLMDLMTPAIYKDFASVISMKTQGLNVYLSMLLLQGMGHLQLGKSGIIDCSELEETLLQLVKKALENKAPEDYVNVIKNSKSVNFLHPTFKEIGKQLEAWLLEVCKTLELNDLVYYTMVLQMLEVITNETFDQLAPYYVQKIPEMSIRHVANLIKIFTKYENATAEMFQILEKHVNGLLDQYLSQELEVEKIIKTDVVWIFKNFAQHRIEDPTLIERFEEFARVNMSQLEFLDVILLINAMTTYKSSNVALLKRLLRACETMLSLEANSSRLLDTEPSHAIQSFTVGIHSVELEYKGEINLSEYPEVKKAFGRVLDNVAQLRVRPHTMSPFQLNVIKSLTEMGVKCESEYPIGPFLVDIFIQPDHVMETNGPDHFLFQTKEMKWKYQRKKRQLKMLGYQLSNVDYDSWERFEHPSERFNILAKLVNVNVNV